MRGATYSIREIPINKETTLDVRPAKRGKTLSAGEKPVSRGGGVGEPFLLNTIFSTEFFRTL